MQLQDLPYELVHRILDFHLDEVWEVAYNRHTPNSLKIQTSLSFLDSRRVCRVFNTAIESLLVRLDNFDAYVHECAPLAKIMLLHAVRRGTSEEYERIVPAIRNGCEHILETLKAMGRLGDNDESSIQEARERFWRAICISVADGVVAHDFNCVRTGDIKGVISDVDGIESGLNVTYRITLDAQETHSIAICGAAVEDDLPLLNALLDQGAYEYSPLALIFEHPLLTAARRGNLGAVNTLRGGLADRKLLNLRDGIGDTILHCAVLSGNIALFDALFTGGLFYLRMCTNGDNLTPIALAVELGNVALAKYIHREWPENANGYVSTEDPEFGTEELLYKAAALGQHDILRYLLYEEGVIPDDYTDCNWRSAISIAAQNDNLETVQLLMDPGLSRSDEKYRLAAWRALRGAASGESLPVIEYLLSHDAILTRRPEEDDVGESALAAMVFNPPLLRRYIDHPVFNNFDRQAALFQAIRYKQEQVVKELIDRDDIDINWKSSLNRTALWMARKWFPAIVVFLVNRGALDVNPNLSSTPAYP